MQGDDWAASFDVDEQVPPWTMTAVASQLYVVPLTHPLLPHSRVWLSPFCVTLQEQPDFDLLPPPQPAIDSAIRLSENIHVRIMSPLRLQLDESSDG